MSQINYDSIDLFIIVAGATPALSVVKHLQHPVVSSSTLTFTALSNHSAARCVTRRTLSSATCADTRGCTSTAGCRSSVTSVARHSAPSPRSPNIGDSVTPRLSHPSLSRVTTCRRDQVCRRHWTRAHQT